VLGPFDGVPKSAINVSSHDVMRLVGLGIAAVDTAMADYDLNTSSTAGRSESCSGLTRSTANTHA
jgi:hypothetical protein